MTVDSCDGEQDREVDQVGLHCLLTKQVPYTPLAELRHISHDGQLLPHHFVVLSVVEQRSEYPVSLTPFVKTRVYLSYQRDNGSRLCTKIVHEHSN